MDAMRKEKKREVVVSLSVTANSCTAVSNLCIAMDLCIPVRPYVDKSVQPECFGLPPASAAPFEFGSFVASVSAGSSINCPVVSSMCFHSNGTHTECVGHALPGQITLLDVFGGRGPACTPLPALLLTVVPCLLAESGEEYAPGLPEDLVVCRRALEAAFSVVNTAWSFRWGRAQSSGTSHTQAQSGSSLGSAFLKEGALVIRTLPNPTSKRNRVWSGCNPPYLTPAAMQWAVDAGAIHLLSDLPSADREDDQGMLLAHRAWWGLPPRGVHVPVPPEAPFCQRTITELCFIPGPPHIDAPCEGYEEEEQEQGREETQLADGPYLLQLQVAPIALDAAPSRPLLHPIRLQLLRDDQNSAF